MFELRPVENGFELRGGQLPESMVFAISNRARQFISWDIHHARLLKSLAPRS